MKIFQTICSELERLKCIYTYICICALEKFLAFTVTRPCTKHNVLLLKMKKTQKNTMIHIDICNTNNACVFVWRYIAIYAYIGLYSFSISLDGRVLVELMPLWNSSLEKECELWIVCTNRNGIKRKTKIQTTNKCVYFSILHI